MDAIFDIDLIDTAKILDLDRLSIVRFKYQKITKFQKQNQQIPSATIEKVFDCHKDQDYDANYEQKYTDLSNSFLLSQAWNVAPHLLKIESEEEISQLSWDQDWKEIFISNFVKSLLFVPLYLKNQKSRYQPAILGYLILQSYTKRTWTPLEVQTLKWVGKQVTTEIINQQTVNKIQSLVDERTSQLKLSLDVQAKLSNKLRFHLDELRESNKVKDEFISSMSDALRTPLSNLKTGIKMLSLRNQDSSLDQYIDILGEECDKEIKLVENLLTIQKLRSKDMMPTLQKIQLAPLFTDIYQEFQEELKTNQITLNINCESDFLLTDLHSLDLIFKELIFNAIKFSCVDTVIYLIIEKQIDSFLVEISNVGAEISADEQEKIFQPFYQGKEIDNVTNSGTGLGLALVKSLVENLNGTIEVSSVLSSNSNDYINTFTITFPQEVHEVY